MIASGSVVFSKWEKALSGTALLKAELVAPRRGALVGVGRRGLAARALAAQRAYWSWWV